INSRNIFPNGGFELGSLYGWGMEAARDSSILIITEPVLEGNYAAKLTLYPGDWASRGHRVELKRPYCAEYQTEMVYSWSFKIGNNFKESDKQYLFHQFHDYPDFLNGETWETMTVYPPPVFTAYLNDTVYFNMHSIEDGHRIIGKKEIVKGEWIKIKYKIKWSLGSDGYIETYINNERIIFINGHFRYYTPTVYNKMGNYLKIGLYTHPSVMDTNSIYIDDLKIFYQ
ncbi:MAG: heparin lyase I family protein, partial [Melioribacteraceae bacterium]|nr:heparin lyase I family protein [Melioribacteraceae bacterium]